MQARDIESLLSRAMLGIIPLTTVPAIIRSHLSLISWDHQKNPGFIWRLSDLTLQVGEGNVSPIDGFDVAKYEVVVVMRGNEPLALIHEGSWGMKPEEEMTALKADKIELVWIDLRTITLQFEVTDIRTETGRHKLTGELAMNVMDPTRLVNKFVISDNGALSKDIQGDVLSELLALMANEAAFRDPDDPSWLQYIEESSKTKLAKRISDWGLMPSNLTLVERREGDTAQRAKTNEIESKKVAKVPNEDISLPSARIPEEATTISRGTETTLFDDASFHMLEWDSAPKRWIPSIHKDKITCDGCDEHPDVLVNCRLSCQFLQKCRLCKDCYQKRGSCVFHIEVEIPPPPIKVVERFAQSTETGRELDPPTPIR